MQLQNKIIVITGGATGIGRALIDQLLPANTVISLDRRPEKIAALSKAHPQVHSIRTDITSDAETKAALTAIANQFGRIDVLINNAGTGGQFDFTDIPEAALQGMLQREITTNFLAPVLLTHGALALLQKSAAPVVVFVSSGLAYMPIASFAGYCASKAAMHAFAMSLRHQLKKTRIKVVEVLPPTVDTDFNKGIEAPKMSPAAFAKACLQQLERGKTSINIGQSRALSVFSRLMPGLAFKMLNR
ncbi:MAG: SDR family NAD(P)-dependent oxidoreductase [Cytophagales bacterium]|nr:SDR family NAD(P)-dependent oxidoreductase [Cytophagales bacterium]